MASCARKGCDKEFIPRKYNHIYCSTECRSLAKSEAAKEITEKMKEGGGPLILNPGKIGKEGYQEQPAKCPRCEKNYLILTKDPSESTIRKLCRSCKSTTRNY